MAHVGAGILLAACLLLMATINILHIGIVPTNLPFKCLIGRW